MVVGAKQDWLSAGSGGWRDVLSSADVDFREPGRPK